MRNFAASFIFLNILLLFLLSTSGKSQEEEETPSQKLKQAAEKFNKGPATVGKKLENLMKAGKEKLRETFERETSEKKEREAREGLTLPKKAERSEAPRYSPSSKRDPFRSLGLKTKVSGPPPEELSPLERYTLAQLKLVAIVWEMKEPRAMVEVTEADNIVRGYTLTVGTRVGPNQGIVRAIRPDEVVIEGSYVDYYGARKKSECRMKLSTGSCS
jgi:Tfp pilus assembly protein PilP